MHPLHMFFDDINRDYWGIPVDSQRERRERERAMAHQLKRERARH